MVQRVQPPQFRTNELLVTFRPRPLGAPSLGSPELARPGVARAVGEAIRSHLAPHVAAGLARVVGVSPALLAARLRSEEHTSELQSLRHLVCRLLLEKKKTNK